MLLHIIDSYDVKDSLKSSSLASSSSSFSYRRRKSKDVSSRMTSSSLFWFQRRHRKSDHSFIHDKDIAFDRHFTQNRDKIRVFEKNSKSNKENIASRRVEYKVFWASNKRKLKYTFNKVHESMKTIVKHADRYHYERTRRISFVIWL